MVEPVVIRYYDWGFCCRDLGNVVTDILNGNKTIETRVYEIPKNMIGQESLLIATYGAKAKSKAVGLVTFSECKIYTSGQDFYKDSALHLICEEDVSSLWGWNSNGDKPKYGWIISKVTKFDKPFGLSKRCGIKFSRNMGICQLHSQK